MRKQDCSDMGDAEISDLPQSYGQARQSVFFNDHDVHALTAEIPSRGSHPLLETVPSTVLVNHENMTQDSSTQMLPGAPSGETISMPFRGFNYGSHDPPHDVISQDYGSGSLTPMLELPWSHDNNGTYFHGHVIP